MGDTTTLLDLWAKNALRRWADRLGPGRDPATAEQVRAFRRERGWTVEQVADEMHATPLEVSAWEEGIVQASARASARIAWYGEMERWNASRDQALLANPPCDWVRENVPVLYEVMFRDPTGFSWHEHHPGAARHCGRCATCKALWNQVVRLGSPPPEPSDSLVELKERHAPFAESLPRWLRRPVRAVLGLAPLALAAVLVAGLPDRDAGISATLTGLGFAAMLGMLAFFVVHNRLSGLRRSHPGRAGLLAGLAASVTGVIVWPMYDASVNRLDPRMWIGAAGVAAATGLIARARARQADPEAPPTALADGAAGGSAALRNPGRDVPEWDPARRPRPSFRTRGRNPAH